MSSMLRASAGKRGHVYECKPCGFKGEKLAVSNHIYLKHLTYDDYPFYCTICNFASVQKAKFLKHPKWYLEHKMMAGENSGGSSFMAVRDNTSILQEVMRSLTVEESILHWESRKRPAKPVTLPVVSSSVPPAASLSSTIPTSSLAFPLSPSSAAVPSVPASEPALPELLTEEDQQLLQEFFVQEPMESHPSLQEENTRLQKELERQRRVIEANNVTIADYQRRFKDSGVSSRFYHDGPGEGEKYNPVPHKNPTDRKKSPKRLQSVVKVVKKILPRPSRTPHRSPLDNLFKPDVPSFHNKRQHRR